MFGPSADLFLSGLFSEEGAFMKRVLDNSRLHKSVRQSEWLRTRFCSTLAKLRLHNWPLKSEDLRVFAKYTFARS